MKYSKNEILHIKSTTNLFGEIDNDTIPLKNAYYRNNKKKSSYKKLFPDNKVGNMIANFATSVHSTSISEGIKLEDYIYNEFKGVKYKNILFEDVINIVKQKQKETQCLNYVDRENKPRVKKRKRKRNHQFIYFYDFLAKKKTFVCFLPR